MHKAKKSPNHHFKLLKFSHGRKFSPKIYYAHGYGHSDKIIHQGREMGITLKAEKLFHCSAQRACPKKNIHLHIHYEIS